MMKFKFYIIMGLLLAGSIGYGYKMTQKYMDEKERSEAFEHTISGLNQEVKTFKVKLNDSISFYAARVDGLKMSKANIEARYGDLLKASKIKPKDVQNVDEVGLQTADTVYVPVEVDKFGGLTTGFHDKFTSIDVQISPKREAAISYEISDSISVINTQKKHSILFGLIKWKELEKTTVISHNPKSKIVGVTSIDVIK